MKIRTKDEWEANRRDAITDVQKRLNTLKPVDSLPLFMRHSAMFISYNSLMTTYRAILMQSYEAYLRQHRMQLIADMRALVELRNESDDIYAMPSVQRKFMNSPLYGNNEV